MSLNFATISPHPPIIVPGIGEISEVEKVANTIVALRKLSTIFNNAEIDTLIIISPHGHIYPDRFNICHMRKLFGTFASFDKPEIIMEAENNLDFTSTIANKMEKASMPYLLYDNDGEFFELDHGIMVPLAFLKQNQESSFKVIPITYSGLNSAEHFAFGQVLTDAIESSNERIGIIASGDLSHQLFQNPEGQVFDKKFVKDIKENNIQDILLYDENYLERIGECGYRSVSILLGALDNRKYAPEILSYEGPFGVGYLVANFDLKED